MLKIISNKKNNEEQYLIELRGPHGKLPLVVVYEHNGSLTADVLNKKTSNSFIREGLSLFEGTMSAEEEKSFSSVLEKELRKISRLLAFGISEDTFREIVKEATNKLLTEVCNAKGEQKTENVIAVDFRRNNKSIKRAA